MFFFFFSVYFGNKNYSESNSINKKLINSNEVMKKLDELEKLDGYKDSNKNRPQIIKTLKKKKK